MNEEVKKLFHNLIKVGYKIRISKDMSSIPNCSYGFLVKEIYDSITEPTNAPSELYQPMISLVNSESFKEFICKILDKKLMLSYKAKLDAGEYRKSRYLNMKVNSKTSDGITELTIGLLLKVHELKNNGNKSYYGMNEFRHGIIVLQILLGICDDQKSSNKLRSLTMNTLIMMSHAGYPNGKLVA